MSLPRPPRSRPGRPLRLLLSSYLLLTCPFAAAEAPGAGIKPAPAPSSPPPPPSPPLAPKVPHETVLHGERRSDPYFWLRKREDPRVRAYLEAENAYADAVLAPLQPLREALYREIVGRMKQTDLSAPYLRDGFSYYERTEEGKQYPILRRRREGGGPDELLLDLNQLAVGQPFLDTGDVEPSDDGRLLAYTVDRSGFRDYTLQVKDLQSGATLPERMEKVADVAWAADGRTLFYVREDAAKRPYRLYRHELGSKAPDSLLYEEKDERFNLSIERSRSRDFLLVASESTTTSEVRVLSSRAPRAPLRLIAPRRKDHLYTVDHGGDVFYVRSNGGGRRNFRLLTANVDAPEEAGWRELVPHREGVMLEEVLAFRDFYVLKEREDGQPQLRVTDRRTGQGHRVPMAEAVYSVELEGNHQYDTRALRFHYQSFTTPKSVYDYDMERRSARLVKREEVGGGFDPKNYETRRLHGTAADGTSVPISVVTRRGQPRDGAGALWLEGYGAYGSPYEVEFSAERISLLDRGVAYAVAHVRGGGDLGKRWHDDGRLLHKRNSFTDFIAAAERLVAERYATPRRLAISGRSAGGLLMAAVLNLRPDLFRAAIVGVPFVDVVNTMADATLPLTTAEFEEWGNPKVLEEYRYLASYCPYSNLRAQGYPAMLVETAWNDSQVMYWEPAKYVARLRTLKTDQNPLLLRTIMNGGHGGSSGRYDRVREAAYDLAFGLGQLGITR